MHPAALQPAVQLSNASGCGAWRVIAVEVDSRAIYKGMYREPILDELIGN